MRSACRCVSSLCQSLALVALISPAVYAHPGHAHEVVSAASPWHYWLQPEHALINGTLLAVAVGLATLTYSRWQAARNANRLTPLPAQRHR